MARDPKDTLTRDWVTEVTSPILSKIPFEEVRMTDSKSDKSDAVQFLEQLQREIPVIAELKPLRVGVRHCIMRRYPDAEPKLIGKVLAIHCGAPRYLRQCTVGAHRYNLDGERDGEVNETHAQCAAERLVKLRERRKLKKQDKQQSQHMQQDKQPDKPQDKQPLRPVPRGSRPILSLKRSRVSIGGAAQ